MAASDRPTAKQLRYLRALAEQTGTTFTPPTTRGQASEAIDALRRRDERAAARSPPPAPPGQRRPRPSRLGQRRCARDEIVGLRVARPLALMGDSATPAR